MSLRMLSILSTSLVSGLILLIYFAMNNNSTEMTEQMKWVRHKQDVIGSTNHLMKLIVDMETGMRGFLLTGNESYFEPYHQAKSEWYLAVENLKEHVADNPTQVDKLLQVESHLKNWQKNIFEKAVSLKQQSSPELMTFIANQNGKKIVDQIRTIMKSFLKIEEASLVEKSQKYLAKKKELQDLLCLGCMFLIGFNIIVSCLFCRRLASGFSSIHEAIQRVEHGDRFDLDENSRSDEFQPVYKAFNQMVNQINVSRKKSIENAKLASIGHLAGGVGHEINNPLAIIFGQTYFLRRRETFENQEEREKYLRHIDGIEESSNRIKSIVHALQEISNVEAYESKPFAINQGIEKTLQLIKEIYLKEGITLTCSLLKEDILVKGSYGKFKNVLMNLLQNSKDALKNIDSKQIAIAVELNDHFVCISIRDSGVGIPKDIKGKIFEPFFTTKAVGEGVGMGLAIAYDYAKEIGGELSFLSEEGLGTVVNLSLPILTQSANSNTNTSDDLG